MPPDENYEYVSGNVQMNVYPTRDPGEIRNAMLWRVCITPSTHTLGCSVRGRFGTDRAIICLAQVKCGP